MKASKMNVKGFLNGNKNKTQPNIETSEESSFKNFIDYSPTPIFRASKNGTLLYVNQAFAKMLGYSSEFELINDLVLNKRDWNSLLSLLKKDNRLEDYPIGLMKEEGEEISKKINIRIVKDNDDKKTYFEGIVIGNNNNLSTEEILGKIKELKEKTTNSEMEQEDSTQSQHLVNITNEIKTPINSIVGILSSIEQKSFNSDEELINFARNARVSVDSILGTIGNIPNIFKTDINNIESDTATFDTTEAKSIELSISGKN